MMLRMIIALLFLAVAPASAQESVVAGLSQHRVAITANFDGTAILIFGAVKRDAPAPKQGPLQVIIAVSGPSRSVLVRRKERVFGIWINRSSVRVDSAPSFYAVASTVPLDQAISRTEDLRYKVSIKNMIRSVGAPDNIKDAPEFSKAIVRIRENNGLYLEKAGRVDLMDDTLFDTEIKLPANLVEGDYKARIFLTRDRQVIDTFQTTIPVRKVGMERWIYNMAHKQPLLYGILSLLIAIGAGWLAATIFRLLRIS